MNGYTLYTYFNAIKLHFTSEKYDIFKSKGRTRSNSYESYLKRPDYKLFESSGKYFKTDAEAIQFIASNVAYGNTNCVYNLDDSVDNYLLFLKRKQSITNVFKNDISAIELEIDKTNETNLFDFSNGQIPLVWKMFLSNQITTETVTILQNLNGFLDNIDMILFKKEFLRIKKFTGFFDVDLNKTMTIYNNSMLKR